ncbi:hypothetical protein BHM03_00052931 [Ensete ventricosum]|nr:hypothetical protein BHM03_00052931 [Ensete ventricosum]
MDAGSEEHRRSFGVHGRDCFLCSRPRWLPLPSSPKTTEASAEPWQTNARLVDGGNPTLVCSQESGHGRPSKDPLPVGGHNDRDKDECSCMRRPRTIAPSADSCNMAGLKRRRIELQEGRSYLPVDSGASVTSRRSDRHKLVDDTLQIDDDRSPSSAGSCSPCNSKHFRPPLIVVNQCGES